MDALAQIQGRGVSNYASIREHMEDAKDEVERLVKKGFLDKVTREEVEKDYHRGTVSKLAIIVKERPDLAKKIYKVDNRPQEVGR